MKKKSGYYLTHGLAVLALTVVVYAGLKQIKADVLTFTISLRCFNNTTIGWEYETNGMNGIKKQRQNLNANLSSIPLQIEILDFEQLKNLNLYLGDTINTFIVEGFSILKRHLSKQQYVYTWNGIDSIETIFHLDHCTFGDITTRYFQIETGNAPSYIKINPLLFADRLIKYKSIYSKFKYIICSILVSLFFCLSYWFKSPSSISRNHRLKSFRINSISVLFIFILFFIFLNTVYPFIPDLKNFENRTLEPKPTLSLGNMFQYPEQLNKYLLDHFAFRSYLVYINSFLHIKCFNVSTIPELVVAGKQDWLYVNLNGSMLDYRQMTKIDTGVNDRIVSNFTQRMEWLKKMNCKFYIFSPPNKERIYPEYMPSRYASKGVDFNSFDYYKGLFQKNSTIDFIDPIDSILKGKKNRLVYFSNDTHWNEYGAFKGYQALMDVIKKSFPELKPIQESEVTIEEYSRSNGDLGKLLGLAQVFYSKGYTLNMKDTVLKLNTTIPESPLIAFRHNKTLNHSNLKLLMIMDSYAYFLIPFLNMHFSESVYVRGSYFMADLIEKERPDIVIFESLERLVFSSLQVPNPPKMKVKEN